MVPTKLVELDTKEKTKYQSIVGELLYAANTTRPDICFITGRLCQYVAKPYEHQLQAAQRVMRYLSQTAHYCMKFGGNSIAPNDSGLTAFSDSDYGECKETRRSTSGHLVLYNGDIIYWSSRRQKIVNLSSTEAEYVALGEAVKEIQWCRNWLLEIFGKDTIGTVIIHEDNQATIQLAQFSDKISQRTKHIDIRHHFLREVITDGQIKLAWIQSKDQLADILTKPLQGETFKYIRNKIIKTE